MKSINKKGQNLNMLIGFAVSIVVFVIVVAMGAKILDSVQGTLTAGTTAYNATGEGLAGLNDLSEWTPTIVTIVVAVFIIALIGGIIAQRVRR